MRVKDRQRRAKRGLTVARNGRGSNTATVRDVRELLRMVQSQLACKLHECKKTISHHWCSTCTFWTLYCFGLAHQTAVYGCFFFVDENECSSEQFGSSKVLGFHSLFKSGICRMCFESSSKPPRIASIELCERFSWLLVVFCYAHIFFIQSLLLWIITVRFDFNHL